MSVATTQASTPVARSVAAGGDKRLDIQALRALAVGAVLVYHLWPELLPGGFAGVDVFFVISGFLISSHLLTRPPRGWRDLVTFWSRRVRRLLPAALTVLLATLGALWVLGAEQLWKTGALDAVSSATYWQNWALAQRAVDYLALGESPSPFQHYWSLSVEEQFYAVWPVLILSAGLVAGLVRTSVVHVAGVVLCVVVAASFVSSLLLTADDPARAYFVTSTRVWELGVGGLVAVWAACVQRTGAAGPVRADSPARGLLAWAGLAAVLAATVLIGPATPFPGWAALLPVLGTAAVIAAASATDAASPSRLWQLPGVQWLGGVSYGVYLWHWPLMTLVPLAGDGRVGLLDRLTVLAASLVLAAVTQRWIEDPARFRPLRSTGRVFAWAAAGTALVVAAGLLLLGQAGAAQARAQAETAAVLSSNSGCVGAAALAPGASCATVPADEVVPQPAQARADRADAYADACTEHRPWTGTTTCTLGPEDAEVSVAVVGNSHAAHWLPALEEIAADRSWRITTYFAAECPATARPAPFSTDADTRACVDWGRRVQEATSRDAYDLVLAVDRTVGERDSADESLTAVQLQDGYTDYLRAWQDSGTRVAVIRDTPTPGRTIGQVPDCVAQAGDDLDLCSGTRSEWVIPDPQADAMAAAGGPVIDLTDRYCSGDVCPAVVGGVLVYADAHHMTVTYARTMAPALAERVVAVLGPGD